MTNTSRLEALEHRRLLAAYFVSPGGNDAAGGTLEAPWQTLATAVSRVAPGDEIVLRSGTYAGGVQVRQPDITIRSYDGERASITAPTDNSAIENCIKFRRVPGGRLINLDISGGYYYGVMADGSWGFSSNESDYAGRLLIEGCRIHDTGRDNIKITPGCNDVVIRNNELYNSGVRDNSNAEGIDNVNADRMIVQDNYFHDIATNGVYAKGGASDCVIERNRIERTGSLGITLGFTTDGEFFDPENTGGYESINGIVRNNIINTSRYGGIGLYSAIGAKVHNNTVLNVANQGQAGIVIAPGWEFNPTGRLVPTRDAEIINNVIGVSGAYPLVQIRADGLDPSGTLVMSNNRYVRQGAAGENFRDDRGARWTGTLAQWQAHAGTDLTSTEGDPGLDAAGRPTASSPLIDAGATLPSFDDDIDRQQRPMGRAWDIGADEADGEALPDTTPPAILARAPAVGATSVAANANVTARFNEIVGPDGVVFTLVGPEGAVPSVVTYDPATRTFTLDPAADLALSSTYTVTLSGVRDVAGNVAADATWTFTTAAPPTTVFSPLPHSGDFQNYTPLVASRWSVTTEGGDARLLLASTTHSGPAEDLLGEYALLEGATFTDFDVTLRARTNEDLAANPSADFAVVFGYVDANNYSYLMMSGRAANTRLFNVVDGVPTAYSAAAFPGVPDAAWHEVRVTRTGSAVTVTRDGLTILSETNEALARAGAVGPGSYNDSAYFDDFHVVGAVDGAKVTDVFVAGGAWSADFRRVLAAQGLGLDTLGYRVAHDGPKADVLPWTNVDQVTVQFDRPVDLGAGDVVVRNVATGAAVEVSAVTPNPAGDAVTILMSKVLRSGQFEVVVGGVPAGVPEGGTSQGVGGHPGGDFAFRFNVLRGDVDRTGSVTSVDLAAARYKAGRTAAQAGPGARAYSVFHDVDANGTIGSTDLAIVRAGIGQRLTGVIPGLFSRRTIYQPAT